MKRLLVMVFGVALGCGGDSGSNGGSNYHETRTEGQIKVLGQEASFHRTTREPAGGGQPSRKP